MERRIENTEEVLKQFGEKLEVLHDEFSQPEIDANKKEGLYEKMISLVVEAYTEVGGDPEILRIVNEDAKTIKGDANRNRDFWNEVVLRLAEQAKRLSDEKAAEEAVTAEIIDINERTGDDVSEAMTASGA